MLHKEDKATIELFKVIVSLYHNNGDMASVARQLNISNITIWNKIYELEKKLELKVYNKQTKSLTNKILRIIPEYEKIIELFESANAKTHKKNDTPSGRIIIGTTKALLNTWGGSSLFPYIKKKNDISLKIIGDDRLDDITTKEADILVRPLEKTPDGFMLHWYAVYDFGLFASKEYIEKHGHPSDPEDLERHTIINYGDREFSGFKTINSFTNKKFGLPPLNPKLTLNATDVIINAVNDGLGISSIPIQSSKNLGKNLVRIFPELTCGHLKFYFATRINEEKKEIYDFFDNHFKETLKKQGYETYPIKN